MPKFWYAFAVVAALLTGLLVGKHRWPWAAETALLCVLFVGEGIAQTIRGSR